MASVGARPALGSVVRRQGVEHLWGELLLLLLGGKGHLRGPLGEGDTSWCTLRNARVATSGHYIRTQASIWRVAVLRGRGRTCSAQVPHGRHGRGRTIGSLRWWQMLLLLLGCSGARILACVHRLSIHLV